MNERNNKLELLGSAPIPKALMALGIPIMIGMLINALYNLVDAYFVSGLGKSQMGAISVVFPLGQVVVGLGLMFGNGAASYLSRLLGRGDKDTADKVASTALYSSILIGAIIILLSTIFLKPILVMLGATETIMPYALTYARIYVLSCMGFCSDLIEVVADPVQLPHHGVIVGRRCVLRFKAIYQVPKIRFTGKSALFDLLLKRLGFLFVQPELNVNIAFSHRLSFSNSF